MKTINIIPNTYVRVAMNLMQQEFNVLSDNNNKDCDFVIVNNSIPDWVDPKRCILQITEPPLWRKWELNYLNKEKYHTVYTYLPSGKNQFYFNYTEIGFPFSIGNKEITREDTTIKTRGIFYAGMRGEYTYSEFNKNINAIDIRSLRRLTVEWFLENYKIIYPYGKGWINNTRESDVGWTNQKFIDIENDHCDFIFAFENAILPNYITEKIFQGFLLDRVVFYLGEPNITNFIPSDCFIDLRPYYKNGVLDYLAIVDLITNMKQSTYDNIINNARNFRKKILNKYNIANIELTKHMIERIKNF